jgi:hypothetical protein
MPWGGIRSERIFSEIGKEQIRGEKKRFSKKKSTKSNGECGALLKKTKIFQTFFQKPIAK